MVNVGGCIPIHRNNESLARECKQIENKEPLAARQELPAKPQEPASVPQRSGAASDMNTMTPTESSVEMVQRLTQHPFLRGMEDEHLELLAQSATSVEFAKDQIIFKAGESANGFYLIESGTV